MLEVDGIDVHYGPIQALRDVSLRVDAGEMVALVGTNGAGKTTTLRTITGLLHPTKGEIRFEGERIDDKPAWDVIGYGISHLPEGRELFADMSVLDNLRLGHWSTRNDSSLDERLDEVMDHFEILRERASQDAGTLSGGEQQMLGVARALMCNPRLLVVDELSLGLAPKIVDQLFTILDDVNKEGTGVLLVEQFVDMALEHTDRAYVLVKGEVALQGTSKELRDDPALMEAYLGKGSGDEPADPDSEAPLSAVDAEAEVAETAG